MYMMILKYNVKQKEEIQQYIQINNIYIDQNLQSLKHLQL